MSPNLCRLASRDLGSSLQTPVGLFWCDVVKCSEGVDPKYAFTPDANTELIEH